MEISQLKPYSYGIVAEDKARGTDVIKVIPIEVNFANATTIDTKEAEIEMSYKNAKGAQDNLKVTMGKTIDATWLHLNSNRVTSPDVKKGDQVHLRRLGETDIYYWEDMNCMNVKRLEHVVFAFGADPNGGMVNNLANAYWMAFSPEDKHITLHTSKMNGEKFGYDLQIDTEESKVVIMDDAGNKIWMASEEGDIGSENSFGTKMHMFRDEVYGWAKDKIHWKTKEWLVECDTATTVAKTKVTHDTPEHETTGNFLVDKDFTYNGKGTGKGTFTVTEAIIAGITFTLHVHTEQGDGKDVSKPK
ncbi:hypothetical protein pEaSNUABM38_00166 [Erwinia phage pEa_SNUABM_38]|nr:hypothetical protein pEaSNUABM38_00166 [Erwinia phage pEa_SNUABM_38]